jgi:hypothetical protein
MAQDKRRAWLLGGTNVSACRSVWSLDLERRRHAATPPASPALLAGSAGAAKDDVVRGDLVAASVFDGAEGRFEALVGERLDLPASVTDEVVMVVSLASSRFEACDAVTEVEPLQETGLGERVKDPIDAREAYRSSRSAQLIVDLLSAEAARLRLEEADHLASCGSCPVTGGSQVLDRAFRPRGRSGRHRGRW